MTSVFSWENYQAFPCFILYSKAKFACYSRYLLTSYFCILFPYIEKDIFWGFQSQKVLQVFMELFKFIIQPTRCLCSWGFSRQEYWSGSPCPLQGIFPTQGSNPGLLHCRQILYCLSHQGSPNLLYFNLKRKKKNIIKREREMTCDGYLKVPRSPIRSHLILSSSAIKPNHPEREAINQMDLFGDGVVWVTKQIPNQTGHRIIYVLQTSCVISLQESEYILWDSQRALDIQGCNNVKCQFHNQQVRQQK